MTLWFETALVGEAWADAVRISHRDGLITAVETGVAPQPDDERCAIGVPGLGNVHSHAFQRAMAGLAETRGGGQADGADSFWTWRQIMYRFLERLGPDDLQAIAALAYAEMLEAGFTRVGEFHYLHHAPDGRPYEAIGEMSARIAAAAEETGVGLTLLPVFYAHGGFGGAPPQPGQRRFLNSLDSFARLGEACRLAVAPLGDAVVGAAPHSLRAATPEEIVRVAAMAPAAPVHIHIAEQTAEVADCLARHGAPPVAWLCGQVEVDGRWCLVHATHADAAEIRTMSRRGAVVGLCPITEANLGDGLFAASAFLAEGGRLAIGSDSNVLIDLAEELRMLEYGQRLVSRSRNVLARPPRPSVGASLYLDALAGGAHALGVAVAAIALGGSLDLVALDGGHPALAGRRGDALLDGWIFAARRGAVQTVWRRGRKVVADGVHVAKVAISARYRHTLARVLAA